MHPIYDSLLMFNSNNVPNLYCFQVLAIKRCLFSHLTLKIAQGQIQGHQNEANIWLHIGVQYCPLTLKIAQGQIQGHQNEANIWLHIGVQYCPLTLYIF